jgi:hypothetical protein
MADELQRFYEISLNSAMDVGEPSNYFNNKADAFRFARDACDSEDWVIQVERIWVKKPKTRAALMAWMQGCFVWHRNLARVYEWDREKQKVVIVWDEKKNTEEYDMYKHRVVYKEDKY